jgi:hypothetical protein
MAGLPRANVPEALSIYRADESDCDIVTMPHEIASNPQKPAARSIKESLVRRRQNVCHRCVCGRLLHCGKLSNIPNRYGSTTLYAPLIFQFWCIIQFLLRL